MNIPHLNSLEILNSRSNRADCVANSSFIDIEPDSFSGLTNLTSLPLLVTALHSFKSYHHSVKTQ